MKPSVPGILGMVIPQKFIRYPICGSITLAAHNIICLQLEGLVQPVQSGGAIIKVHAVLVRRRQVLLHIPKNSIWYGVILGTVNAYPMGG